MKKYDIDTGPYGNGYRTEEDEFGLFVYADDAEDEIARLTRERDEAVRVAVWAAKNGNVRIHHYRNKHKLAYFDEELNETAKIEFNGHDPDLYRALVEACEGGRDGE